MLIHKDDIKTVMETLLDSHREVSNLVKCFIDTPNPKSFNNVGLLEKIKNFSKYMLFKDTLMFTNKEDGIMIINKINDVSTLINSCYVTLQLYSVSWLDHDTDDFDRYFEETLTRMLDDSIKGITEIENLLPFKIRNKHADVLYGVKQKIANVINLILKTHSKNPVVEKSSWGNLYKPLEIIETCREISTRLISDKETSIHEKESSIRGIIRIIEVSSAFLNSAKVLAELFDEKQQRIGKIHKTQIRNMKFLLGDLKIALCMHLLFVKILNNHYREKIEKYIDWIESTRIFLDDLLSKNH